MQRMLGFPSASSSLTNILQESWIYQMSVDAHQSNVTEQQSGVSLSSFSTPPIMDLPPRCPPNVIMTFR